MAHYFTASYDITDKDKYENEYIAAVIPLLIKHGGQVLVADYETEAIEGTTCSANIVLKFADEDSAKAWYNDPDYEPVKQIRFDATSNGSAAFVKEFVPPTQ